MQESPWKLYCGREAKLKPVFPSSLALVSPADGPLGDSALMHVPSPLFPLPPVLGGEGQREGAHAFPTSALTLTPDGSLLAAGNDEGVVTVWRVNSRAPAPTSTQPGSGHKF